MSALLAVPLSVLNDEYGLSSIVGTDLPMW